MRVSPRGRAGYTAPVPTYDAQTAECFVYTYKEGFLSKVAHDLKLRVRTFELDLGDDAVQARFDARSIECVCAMIRGEESPRALSERDKRQVVQNMARDVLHTARFQDIRFASTKVAREGDHWRIRGRLTLHGIERMIDVKAQPEGEHVVARVRLHQPDFRIVPYTAMLGTLKIKPEVDVVVRVPRGDSGRQ